MFRLGVVSDSHGGRAMVEQLCPLLKDLDAVAHLGDGMGDASRIAELTGLPVYSVAGNCDLLPEYPLERTEVFSGVKTLLTHGNLLKVKHSLMRLALRAEEVEAGLALFGHTHAPVAEWSRGVLLVNPGALMNGRYAIIEFRKNGPCPFLLNL
jgi:putative phosphoesterase